MKTLLYSHELHELPERETRIHQNQKYYTCLPLVLAANVNVRGRQCRMGTGFKGQSASVKQEWAAYG